MQLDESASESFVGYLVAAYSLGMAVSSPLVGYWSNRSKRAKTPIFCCLLLYVVSNLLYAQAGDFPDPWHRKWAILVARLVNGMGSGKNC